MQSIQLMIGLIFGAVTGYSAWRLKSLSTSGAWAATITGGLIFGLGGLPWAAVLLTFFISSSLLSKTFERRKAGAGEKFAKGSERDWQQVAANGGLGALLVILHSATGGEAWTWAAYCGAMAAVNADTWATEIGVLSKMPPRSIVSMKPVEAGTSGGISPLGTLATIAGATLIAVVGAAIGGIPAWPLFVAAAAAAGTAGSLVDSLLGATVQAIYYCPRDQKETEQHPTHRCGTATKHVRGWKWLNNDLVNFVCSLSGAMLAAALWGLLG